MCLADAKPPLRCRALCRGRGRGLGSASKLMVDTPAVEAPFSPDISHENPADRNEWFGHPRQLARLFTTEAMERFGYYGMRALLTLYLAQHFLFSDTTTTGLYGGFTAL